MKAALLGAAIAALSFCTPAAASAHRHHHHAHHGWHRPYHHGAHRHASIARRIPRAVAGRAAYALAIPGGAGLAGENARRARASGLPWCGAFMADLYHLTGRIARLAWVAAYWAHLGHSTSPHVGAVVVWRHHVGKIVGRAGDRWIILSGNDGHRVRSRPRSLAGHIAVRDI